MSASISEESYFDDWYEWEVVEKNLKIDISPEAMVAINSGFGTAKGIPNMTGELQWNDEKLAFEIGNLMIRRSRKVKFYKQAALFEITDLNDSTTLPKKVIMKDSKIRQLYLNDAVYQLDNSNGPIYSANARFGVELDERSAIDYVYFFFINVKGRSGRFYPVSSFDELQALINISEGNATPRQYTFSRVESDIPDDPSAMNYTIKPFIRQDTDSGAGEAGSETPLPAQTIIADNLIIVFKDSIFSATVSINVKDGAIALSNEKLLYESHPATNEQEV